MKIEPFVQRVTFTQDRTELQAIEFWAVWPETYPYPPEGVPGFGVVAWLNSGGRMRVGQQAVYPSVSSLAGIGGSTLRLDPEQFWVVDPVAGYVGPMRGPGSSIADVWVNWGDGSGAATIPVPPSGYITHEYPSAGSYEVFVQPIYQSPGMIDSVDPVARFTVAIA